MSEYTQGVCHDGAAILKDGQPLTIEQILEALRERDVLAAHVEQLVSTGTEFINADDVEDEEDAAAIQSRFNDSLLAAACQVTTQKDQHLGVTYSNERLIISIGIETLCHAISIGRPYGQGDIKVTDRDAFTKGLLLELKREAEDGTTSVHSMFDEAVNEMLENGEEGLEFEDDQ